jgi:hypothetical protein
LTIEGVVVWEFAPTFDAAHRAALESGKPVIYVCPPAGWAVAPLLNRLPPASGALPDTLVLAPDSSDIADIAGAARGLADRAPAHGTTGLTRTRRLLTAGAVRTLICTPSDAVALARQSALALSAVRHLVLAWPEHMVALDDAGSLDTVLAETHAAQRLIATSDDRRPELTDLLTRLAHRAPVVAAARAPEQPFSGITRFLTAGSGDRIGAVVATLDALHPATTILWDPAPRDWDAYGALLLDPTVSLWERMETTSAAPSLSTSRPRTCSAHCWEPHERSSPWCDRLRWPIWLDWWPTSGPCA